jgi:hypothetical protein
MAGSLPVLAARAPRCKRFSPDLASARSGEVGVAPEMLVAEAERVRLAGSRAGRPLLDYADTGHAGGAAAFTLKDCEH